MPIDCPAQALLLLHQNPVLYDKIVDSIGIEREAVPALLTEVLRFLEMAATLGERLTPSQWVDLAWHEFILFTRAYSDFCQIHWGKFIHHHPGGEEKENKEAFRRTHYLYAKTYGMPAPTRFWGHILAEVADESDCGI